MQNVISEGQLAQTRDVVRKAGRKIMEMRGAMRGIHARRHKPDGSPFCDADLESHNILVEGFHAVHPGIRVLSEENKPEDNLAIFKGKEPYWAIDPLDLTNRYLLEEDHPFNRYFSINAALMVDGKPAEGIQYFPALGLMYFTAGDKAWRQEDGREAEEIRVSLPNPEARRSGLIAAVAPNGDRLPDLQKQVVSIGRHRACLVAEGSVTFCTEKEGFCLWDVAAIHAVVNQAGGCFRTHDGQEMPYSGINGLPAFFAGHARIIEGFVKGLGNSAFPIASSGRG